MPIREQVFTETELRQRAIGFDRLDRREFLFPNLAAQSFDLLTLTARELNGGVITGVGVDCEEWDFFAFGEYLFQIQRIQPANLNLKAQDGNAAASEIQRYRFRGLESTEHPRSVYIPLKQRYVWSIVIQARAGVPATGFRVANLYIRTTGYLFR